MRNSELRFKNSLETVSTTKRATNARVEMPKQSLNQGYRIDKNFTGQIKTSSGVCLFKV
jgi:hypothetical protein